MQQLEFVGADQQILTTEQYQLLLDDIAVAVRKPLVARTVMPTRPHPWEISEIKRYQQTDMSKASIGMAMVQGAADILGITPKVKAVPVIWKDFQIYLRDLEASHRTGIPLDTSFAQEAGRRVAELEEELSWEGAQGFEGFMNLTGRQTEASAGAWSTVANAYQDVRDAIKDLNTQGYPPPYKLILDPAQIADLRAFVSGTAEPAINKVADLLGGMQNIATAYFFADTQSAILCAPDPANFELLYSPVAVHSAPLPTGDWFFRVYEAVLPDFKPGREKSVVEITGITV